MNSYMESITVILPFQINKKDTDIWKSTSEISTYLEKELKPFMIGKKFSWKKIENDNDNAIGVEKAFENQTNLQMFHQNFTPEVAETIYNSSQKIIHLIATLGNESIKETIKEGTLGFAKVGNKIQIVSCEKENHVLYKIRKIHISATVFGSCLLIIEMYQKIIKDKQEILTEQDYWDIENICKSIGIVSNEKTEISFPTRCHPYIAKLSWEDSGDTDVRTDYEKMSVHRIVLHDNNYEEMEKDIIQFFSKTFECFWINALQKTVAMYISSWAGSDKITHKSFVDIYEAYVLFDNQFNFLEVSFNPEIQKEYQIIKDSMEIDNNIEKLSRQIEALRSINLNKKDDKRNVILAFISVLSLITGCMQVTESFGATPNICANIIAGGASIIIGLVLFFIFVK